MSEILALNLKAYEALGEVYGRSKIPTEEDPKMRADCRKFFADALYGKKEILEVGCGPGLDAWYFQEAGFPVLATDFSPKFIALVKKRFPKLSAQVLDMTAPLADPSIRERRFDGIYAFAAFQHVPRELAASTLAGFRELLRPKGVLSMTLLESATHPEYVIEDWGGLEQNPVHFICYSKAEIQELLERVGFRRVEFSLIDSPVYAQMPRLVERGVTTYQVLARVGRPAASAAQSP